MRKIFSILVVLMMVAGTFVSCSKPTDVSTGAGTSASSNIIAEGSDGALCIVRDERGEVFFCTKAASVFEGYYSNAGFSPVNIANAPTGVPNVFKRKLYMTPEQYNGTDDGYFENGLLIIPSSVLSTSTGTLTYNGYTLQYKIQR